MKNPYLILSLAEIRALAAHAEALALTYHEGPQACYALEFAAPSASLPGQLAMSDATVRICGTNQRSKIGDMVDYSTGQHSAPRVWYETITNEDGYRQNVRRSV